MKRKLIIALLFISISINQLKAQNDLRKETIYFLLTTRFFDGDSTNNAPNEWCSYIPGVNNANITDPKDVTWRGDFKGLIQKLDYIKGMGFTAIWITPIVQNRGPLDYHGYHGWDFTKVDKRLESVGATFQDLVNAVHAKGMKLILDIVTNHSCRFGIKDSAELSYNTDPTKPWGKDKNGNVLQDNPNWQFDGLTKNPDDNKLWSRANLKKMPAPYNNNLAAWNWPCTEAFVNTSDPNWFHKSGNGFAQGWDDTTNLYQRALADDCPDINTGSKAVQDYMFNCYRKFIDMGVDGFRWDTWKHMNKQDIMALADRFKAYKPDLFIMGEVAQKRFDLHSVQEINPHWYTWRGDVGTSTGTDYSVLDFYGEATFHNTFENGSGFSGVTDAARYDNLYSDPTRLVTWLDNHDFGPNNDWNKRYSGSNENLAACMNFMFTWRGVPCVYYGTESRFKAGAYCDIHDASGVQKSINETGRAYYGDQFATAQNHIIYKHLKKLNDIRKALPALQYGAYGFAGNYPGNGIGFTRVLPSQTIAVGLAKDGAANFTFNSMPNGIYRDAVTGREVTVTNGTLSFSVASVSAGVYVLNGPGIIGESGVGYFEPCVIGCNPSPKLIISPVGDNYYSPVTVSITTSGGTGTKTIYYTTDGSTPTTSSAVYTASFTVSAETTVKAISVDANGKISDIEAQLYTFKLPKPIINFNPPAGNYYNPINIVISANNGTQPYKIYFTTNGTTPDTVATGATTLFNGNLAIGSAITIKAIVLDSNHQVSDIVTASYTFNIPNPTVTATPPSGNFPSGSVNVSLIANSPKPPVKIYYTVDGSTPTISSTLYTTPIAISNATTVIKYFAVDSLGNIGNIDSSKYTFNPIPDITIYFKKPANWATPVKIHYFNGLPSGNLTATTWPGINCTQVCPNGNWWKYTVGNVTSLSVVFNDGAGKQTIDLNNIATDSYFDFNTKLTTPPDVEAPVAKLTANPVSGTAPLTVNFDASASTGCTTLGYFWDFGNGNTQQTGLNATTSQTYTTNGTYNMFVVVQDQNNKRDTVKQTITINALPVGQTIHLKPATSWTNLPPKMYYWNTTPTTTAVTWPGVTMIAEGNGWYKYTIVGANCSNIVFNNNSSPQTPDQLNICNEAWYDGTIPAWVSNPLSLQFLVYDVQLKEKSVINKWQVFDESKTSAYNVQRSKNGKDFITIGTVEAKGLHEYLFADKSLVTSEQQASIYYRIEAIDKNGSKTYSSVKTILLNPETVSGISVYPNPTKGTVHITCRDVKQILVIDNLGKIVKQYDSIILGQTFDLKFFAKGIYLVKAIMKNGETKCEKLIVE